MKLRTKITLFIILINIFSLGSMTFLSYLQMKLILNEQLEDRLSNIAYYVSEDYLVKDALMGNKNIPNLNINDHIEKIRIETGVDFITVIDMEGIRLTHPNEKNIGKRIRGGDEGRVLEKAERYISEAKGTLGTSIRAFVPIFYDGRQIGAVSVGNTLVEINYETYNKTKQFIPYIIIGLILGVYWSLVLASSIKDEIMGLEPKEIALLLKEKNAILENVKEGIVTLNESGNVIQYNKEASRILGLYEEDINYNFRDLINRDQIHSILNDTESYQDFEIKISTGITILCKNNILKDDKNQVIGQVINFRDMTEVKRMAEELTGIKKMAWSLRAQKHEFMNKLHTISGLIQLEEYDEAIKYISKTANSSNDVTGTITKKIKNMNVAAFLLSKYYHAEELRIKLEIDKHSYLNKIPHNISEEDLISIIGNLIENSFEAVNVDGTGEVLLKIIEEEDKLIIELSDNGPGIPSEIAEKIYERNFSTKSEHRGYGMFIVKNIIEDANGEITLSVDDGTSWHIEIPMEEGGNL